MRVSDRTLRFGLKPVVFLASLAPFVWIAWSAYAGNLSANPLSDITHDTGDWTLRFVCITLAITPLRLAVPWKYGFKHIKSIVKVKFVERQPLNTWQESASNEYGFYANVNPTVDHPRWSQAQERRIGEFFMRKTLMFNGYGDQVASLYNGMDLRKNY